MTPIFIFKNDIAFAVFANFGTACIAFLFLYIFGYIIQGWSIDRSRSYTSCRVTHAFRCLRDSVYIKAINDRVFSAIAWLRNQRRCFSDSMSSIFKLAHGARGAHGAFYRLICVYRPLRIGEELAYICWSLAWRLFTMYTWNNLAAFIRSVTLYVAIIYRTSAGILKRDEKKKRDKEWKRRASYETHVSQKA